MLNIQTLGTHDIFIFSSKNLTLLKKLFFPFIKQLQEINITLTSENLPFISKQKEAVAQNIIYHEALYKIYILCYKFLIYLESSLIERLIVTTSFIFQET